MMGSFACASHPTVMGFVSCGAAVAAAGSVAAEVAPFMACVASNASSSWGGAAGAGVTIEPSACVLASSSAFGAFACCNAAALANAAVTSAAPSADAGPAPVPFSTAARCNAAALANAAWTRAALSATARSAIIARFSISTLAVGAAICYIEIFSLGFLAVVPSCVRGPAAHPAAGRDFFLENKSRTRPRQQSGDTTGRRVAPLCEPSFSILFTTSMPEVTWDGRRRAGTMEITATEIRVSGVKFYRSLPAT